MALIVIVSVSVDGHAPFPNLMAEIDPTTQLLFTVHNDFAPSFCDRFNLFAITEPANVGPVGGNRIEFQFRGTWHPRAILKHEGDLVIPQEVQKFGVEPV